MTLAFWAGFAVGTLMWLAVTVLAAIRVAGMCSEEERARGIDNVQTSTRVVWPSRDNPGAN